MIDQAGDTASKVFAQYPKHFAILLLVAWALVRFIKDPRTPGFVAPKYRPWLAAGVGTLGGVVTALVDKLPVLDGALTGFFAGGGAVLLQSWFIEPVKASPPLQVALFAFVIGCGEVGQKPAEVVGEITQSIYPVDERLRLEFGEDIAACNDDVTCEAKTREDWKPAMQAMQKIRETWCAIKPEDCRE